MTWAIPSLRSEKFRKPEPPEKSVSFRKYDFRGFRLSIDHFGQQAPKRPCVSASKWCINIFSTSFQCELVDKVQLILSIEIF